jgi:hypothetical protein
MTDFLNAIQYEYGGAIAPNNAMPSDVRRHTNGQRAHDAIKSVITWKSWTRSERDAADAKRQFSSDLCVKLHRRSVCHDQTIAATFLRGIERSIGCLDQRRAFCRALRVQSDSRSTQTHRYPFGGNVQCMGHAKLPKTLPDLLADEFATYRIGTWQEHNELFPAIPGGQIGGSARLCGKCQRDRLQTGISSRMSVLVVEFLEMI